MKVTKTYGWTLKDGREAQAKITLTKEERRNIANLDGDKVDLGTKTDESMDITVTFDGKQVLTTQDAPSIVIGKPYYSQDFQEQVEALGGYALLGKNIVLTEDDYNGIMATITEAANIEANEEKQEEIEIPTYAIEAYKQYKGDAEAAWKNEDDQAWAVLTTWGKIIAKRGV